jgi:copper resistance protein C
MLVRSLSLLALVAALAVGGGAASAHDELIGSDPQDGATVAAVEDLTLTYSGQISPVGAAVQVEGPDGSVTVGGPTVDGAEVVQPLEQELTPGDYAVVWRVTSQDGHPISGEFTFTLQAPDAEQATSGPGQTAGPEQTTAAGTTAPAETTAPAPAVPESSDPVPDTGDGLPTWAWALVVATLGLLGAAGVVRARARR